MQAAPLVSIITPSRDTAGFIGKTIASVRAQTFPGWEMILVDDGSIDDSLAVIAHAAGEELGRRITVHATKGGLGPAKARNQAISMAQGRYIAFLDSDDLWYPEKLERQLAFMEWNSLALSHSAYELMEEDGRWLDRVRIPPTRIGYRGLLPCNVIGCLTAIYDAGLLGKVYMPDIAKRQDHGLWLRILELGYEAVAVPEILAAYRLRAGSVSMNKYRAAWWQWRLYREVEELGMAHAAWTFGRYGWNGVFRGRRERDMTQAERSGRPWP